MGWNEMFIFVCNTIFFFKGWYQVKYSFSDHQKRYFIGSLICWKMTIKLIDHCLIVIFQKIKVFHTYSELVS